MRTTSTTKKNRLLLATIGVLVTVLIVLGIYTFRTSENAPSTYDHTSSKTTKRGGIRTSDMAGMSVEDLYALIRYQPGAPNSAYIFHLRPENGAARLPLSQQIIGPVCAQWKTPQTVELWIETYPQSTVSKSDLKAKAHENAGLNFTEGLLSKVPQCQNTVTGIGYDEH